MKGIFYLWRTTLKNQIKDLKRHPGKLVAYIVLIAIMVLVFVSSAMQGKQDGPDSLRSIEELGAIIFALFMFLFVTQVMQGISTGATFFKMSDVNLLFVSPTSPKKILAYGLVRQMGMSLLISFFILFQAGTLKGFYGVGIKGVFIIFAGYYIVTFMSSVVSMAIYAITSGNERNKKIAKGLVYICIAPVIISILFKVNSGIGGVNAIIDGINFSFNQWIPFVGWIKALTYGAVVGNMEGTLIYFILTILAAAIVIIAMIKSNNNYYEDVLGATENLHSRMVDAKNGKVAEVGINKKIKLKSTGINHGKGANVFFYKHMLENRRAGKVIFDTYTIIQVVIALVFTVTMNDYGNILITFSMATYVQLFMSFTGRWVRELTMHYIYIMPQSPFRKLISVISEGILKSFIDGVIIFVLVGIMLKSSPVEIGICILARGGFGVLFIAADVLAQRVLKTIASKGLLMILNFIVIIIVALPGIIGAGVVAGITNGSIVCLLITLAWNIIISLIIIGLCRNVLHNLEQNN